MALFSKKLIYRLFIKIMLAFCISACSSLKQNAVAQTNKLQQRVNISVTNVPLQEFLSQIEAQTGLVFAYNPQKIPIEALVTYNHEGSSLSQILDFIEDHYHLSSKYFEKQIALLVNANKPTLTFQLSGKLNNSSNGEALIGASIWVDSIRLGTSTNGYGFFSIAVPYGYHVLHSSYIGYTSTTDSIFVNKNKAIAIALSPANQALNEVVISATKSLQLEEMLTGKTSINPKMTGEITAALGENDVLKSLALIPGIKLQSEGSTFFYVRGGNKDQNLILIDDAPIYNPTHMFGLISTLIPETTNSVDVYKADFPMSKRGRLSSVIDIKTKEGNKKKFSGWGNLGLVSTQLGIEGPIKKEISSYSLTGRFSRIKWFLNQNTSNLEKAFFYDITGKLNTKINNENTILASFYSGSDKFLTRTNGLEWSNFNGSIRWNSYHAKTFVNTTLYGSNYEYLFHYDRTQQTSWRSRIGELGLKTDISNYINDQLELHWGGAVIGRTMNPGNLTGLDSLPDALIVSVKNNIEAASYAQLMYKYDKWRFKTGLRASAWNSIGQAFEFTFNNAGQAVDTLTYVNGEVYNTYFNLAPNATISYRITNNTAINVNFDHTIQNLHLITSSISPFTSFEVWLPSEPNIKPQKANQLSLGLYQIVPNAGISVQLMPYVKKLFNQIDYKSHPSTLLNPTVESQLEFGTTNTWGIEFEAKKETGKWRGILGYTYAKAMSNFSNLNNGNSFIANSDRPHYWSATLQYNATERILLTSNFIFTSGIPFSSPTSFYLFNGSEVPVYSSKNNSRMPPYHRLDLAVKFTLNKALTSRFKHSLTLAVYNVYGRKNPVFINFNKIENNGSIVVPGNVLNANRITTKQYVYGIAPSLNYQFRF